MRRLGVPMRPILAARLFVFLLYIASCPLIAGCGTALDEQELQSLFDQGEFMCREARWNEARVVLKKFLLHRPNHAGAHFYLGRAYLFSDDFRPAIAEGELQTALELFIQGGRISPIERFGHDYFELICNVESAKVFLLHTEYLLLQGAPPEAVKPLLERAAHYAHEADAVMPGTKDVKLLEEAIAGYLTPPRTPSTQRPISRGRPTNV